MSSDDQVEPAADLRLMASMLRQTYLALVREGFTEQQSLTVIGQMILANRPTP